MKRRILAGLAVAGWLAAAGWAGTADAHADAATYYQALDNQGLVTWDYPLMLQQGNIVCGMLYDDINPMGWLTTWVGYDTATASSIITAARIGLCPGNYVSAPAPRLLEAI